MNLHVFAHEAMGTTFEIHIIERDTSYAEQAAMAAFEELDIVEGHLSRFIEGSDISRINRLPGGASTVVTLDTFHCLRIALRIQTATGGAFDVAYDSAVSLEQAPIQLERDGRRVRVNNEAIRLDLGGIGKGYGLDRMAALLRDWDICAALLQASTSTYLALAAPPDQAGWSLDFGPAHDRRRVALAHSAFSASGTSVRGNHILDPRTRRPAESGVRSWAGAPKAAVADALSTAFLVMKATAVKSFCERHRDCSAFLQPNEPDSLLAFGSTTLQSQDPGNRITGASPQ